MNNFMSEKIDQLTAAVIEVMRAVKGVEKGLSVGTGNSSYKGVGDKDVKEAHRDVMGDNGLIMVPIEVEPNCQVNRWEEKSDYGSAMKQSVFTEVRTKYLLSHTSGQWVILAGYGHGVDSQDKSAGKATTYAAKYALLYSFLTPTGKIDDADSTHSSDADVPRPTPNTGTQEKVDNGLPWIKPTQVEAVIGKIQAAGSVEEKKEILGKAEAAFKISKANLEKIQAEVDK